MTSEAIWVEVAYALPDHQRIERVQVRPGCSALEAVRLSGIEQHFEDLTISDDVMLGIFGQAVDHDHVLRQGDRVEIYRPLRIDPKEVRKARAERAREQRVKR